MKTGLIDWLMPEHVRILFSTIHNTLLRQALAVKTKKVPNGGTLVYDERYILRNL
jgi:hypothetical protein